MTKQRAPRAGQAADRRRKHRRRPTPKWLESTQELDAIARARCLMVLSVLSGEKPVTEAIGEAKISRGTYYQMETRVLKAMLAALNPLAGPKQDGSADLAAAAARIEELQARIERLEQDKRRAERLLLLTRKAIRAPVTTGRRGRRPKDARQGLIATGKTHWRISRAKASATAPSTPTRAGENGP